jgi:hypothetical protein
LFSTAKKEKRIALYCLFQLGLHDFFIVIWARAYYTPTDRPSGGPHAAHLRDWGVGRAAGPPAFVLVL